MDIAANSEVYCTDGFYGHSTYIILDPATERVTHLAVRKDEPFSHERLVPVTAVVHSTPHRVDLSLTHEDVDKKLPPFFKTEFLDTNLPAYLYTTDLIWPNIAANVQLKTLERENIPLHELAVRRGATVEASDGPVGQLAELVVDPDTLQVSEIVVRAGHWYGATRLAIPASAIDHFDRDTIRLSLSKHDVDLLRGEQERKAAR